MKVILTKTVPKLGKANDVVEVSKGFAANALFPKKLAIPATEAALAAIARSKQNKEAEVAIRHTLLDKAIESLEGQAVTISMKANENGSLFSKLDEKAIAAHLLEEHRLSIDPKCIILPDGHIKKVGEYELTLSEGSYKSTIMLEVLSR